jgi:hypothetical protein
VKRSTARELPLPEFRRRPAIRSSKQIRWSQGGTDLGVCYACASPVNASRAARSGLIANGTRSVKHGVHARSATSIVSVHTSCLTLHDRCLAVWDIQHRRTRASRGAVPFLDHAFLRDRSSVEAIERQAMLAARSPSQDGRRIERHAHAPELVQAVRDAASRVDIKIALADLSVVASVPVGAQRPCILEPQHQAEPAFQPREGAHVRRV